jgi:hypothetical protein
MLKRDPKAKFVLTESGFFFKRRQWQFAANGKSASAADATKSLEFVYEQRKGQVNYRRPGTKEWVWGIPEPAVGQVEYRDPATSELVFGVPKPPAPSYTPDLLGKSQLDESSYQLLLACQETAAVLVMSDVSTKNRWWMFKGEFYVEDEGYSAAEVQALIADYLLKKKRKVDRALARVDESDAASPRGRQPIPDDVRMFVWQRDGGRCVKCGCEERLEFDHIIPLTRGGSNTARNVQLLCATCNRSKGGEIV